MDALSYNDLYGIQSSQLIIYKQKNVPLFNNESCEIILDNKNRIIDTFHGDGGVHFTIKDHEIERKSSDFMKNKNYIIFLSDRNYLQFKSIPYILGKMLEDDKINIIIPAYQKMQSEDIVMLTKREERENDSKSKNNFNIMWGD